MLGPILDLNNNLCPFLTTSNSSTETGSKSFVGVNVILLSDVFKERTCFCTCASRPRSKRTAYRIFLWSRTVRWRGRASFCGSLKHASCQGKWTTERETEIVSYNQFAARLQIVFKALASVKNRSQRDAKQVGRGSKDQSDPLKPENRRKNVAVQLTWMHVPDGTGESDCTIKPKHYK